MVSTVFSRLTRENHRSALEVWADSVCVEKVGVTQDRLRGVPEAVGGEPCFPEDVTFDIAGHGFRISAWLLGLAVVIEGIGPKTLQRHMGPPGVVPAFELGAQERPVVESLDQRDVFEPLVLERLDDPLGYGDGSVFP